MKKIIYSLVIMIAAGSLFTSCIDQVEPVGILDMRTAKAEYIRALKDLRAADAEYRRAEAAVQQANAAYRQAETAWMQEQVNNQKLLNELQALYNEAQAMDNELKAAEVAKKIADLENAMEEAAAQHEINMVNLENNLAKAEEDLRVTLRNIALAAQELTTDEKQVIQDAANYYWKAYEEVAEQTIAVMKAQRLVDSLKEAKVRFADKKWDDENLAYTYKVDLWQRAIDRAVKTRDKYQAILDKTPTKANVTDLYPDVKEWKATLDELKEDKAELEYSKHELVEEISAYYVNYVHDGWKAFNDAAKAWEEENVKPSKDVLSHEDSVLIEKGVKKPEDFKKQNAKVIEFPALTKTQVGNGVIYGKYAYLLQSYFQNSPIDLTPKKYFIEQYLSPADSLDLAAVNQSMKEFILGAKDAGENAQVLKDKDGKKIATASYGLKGAYSILERELVSDPDKAPTAEAIEAARKKMVAKDSIWAAHRAILVKGLAKHDPFSIEYAPLATAISEYEAAVADDKSGVNGMINAIAELKAALESVNNGGPSKNDSIRIINAFKAYAEARQAYFVYPTKNVKQSTDSTYFVFAKGTNGSTAILDSVLFTALSYEDLLDGRYLWDRKKTETDMRTFDDATARNAAKNQSFANIANQLFGATMANLILENPSTYWDITDAVLNDGTNYTGFYKTYKYDSSTDPATIKFTNGDKVEAKEVKTKRDAVLTKVNAYVTVYNKFWAQTVAEVTATVPSSEGTFKAYFDEVEKAEPKAADIKTAKENAIKSVEALFNTNLKPTNYTAATFKPYGDDEPIVTFTGNMVDTTVAMQAILASVDPNSVATVDDGKEDQWMGKTFEEATAIFKRVSATQVTDFWTACKAEYDYWVISNTKVKENLKEIENWIVKVEECFLADAKQAGEDDPDAYAEWVEDYAAATALADSIANYAEALATYTGVDEDGNANGIFKMNKYDELKKFFNQDKEELKFNAADRSTLFDEFTGEWNEKLGGTQLALAKVLFPDAPVELMEWEYAYAEINDEISHCETVYKSLEKAYIAAAKAAEYTEKEYGTGAGQATLDTLIADLGNALNAYRSTLNSQITTAKNTIKTNTQNIADFWSEVPVIDIAIAEAEVDLAEAETKYNAAVTALDYAKANLQRVMDYMKSLDANFLNGSELEFPWNATTTGGTTGGSTTGGSTWPSFPWI